MSDAAKVETFVKDLMSCVQTGRIYTVNHPYFIGQRDVCMVQLKAILQNRRELVVGIVGYEMAFETEIFFDLSQRLGGVIRQLKSHDVERLVFGQDTTAEELTGFVSFLMTNEYGGMSPVQFLTSLGVTSITIGKISPTAAAPAGGKSSAQTAGRTAALDSMRGAMDKMINAESLDVWDLNFSVNHVMENITGKYEEFLKLAVVKEYDTVTFSHALNVSTLSMYFAARLGFTREDCREIGVAALFHDIGKVYISKKIIAKTDKLSDEEFQTVRSHTILGAEILAHYVPTLGILPMVVAFEHHLKYNLQGYPRMPFVRPLHMISLLVSICDVYDALTQRRSYKRDYPPLLIYELMMRERGALFAEDLLDKFFKIMGVWPVGTITRLSDDSIAVVRRANESDIFAPMVEILHPVPAKELVDLKEHPKLKIVSALNPLGEGKEFLERV